MNPFDQLIRLADGRRVRPRLPARIPREQAPTKVGTLLGYLREAGPASTLTLCHLLEVDSRIVWGLLKAPRARGEVHFAGGIWAVAEGFNAEMRKDLQAAAQLLRANGWAVQPPGAAS
jgi:hypothetical protein